MFPTRFFTSWNGRVDPYLTSCLQWQRHCTSRKQHYTYRYVLADSTHGQSCLAPLLPLQVPAWGTPERTKAMAAVAQG